VKVVRSLYGLKSSGASWRAMFNTKITEMGFIPTIADPDACQQANAKPDDFKYYEYILVYVDDVLIISPSPQEHFERVEATYELIRRVSDLPRDTSVLILIY
jgi:hypothetical protein